MQRWLMFTILLFAFSAQAETVEIKDFDADTSPIKALVFLSDACPCSRSHVEHLNQLKADGLNIYGVISEPPYAGMPTERRQIQEEYFKSAGFQFPFVNDPTQSLVKKYHALKTPHVTLFQKQGDHYEIIYEGGVTNQKDFAKSTVHYLEENWHALKAGHAPKYNHGFSLGCYIRRN
jgi:hypothetical protein